MEICVTATPISDIEIPEGPDAALRVFEANAMELAEQSFISPRLLRSWIGRDSDGVVKMHVLFEALNVRANLINTI